MEFSASLQAGVYLQEWVLEFALLCVSLSLSLYVCVCVYMSVLNSGCTYSLTHM